MTRADLPDPKTKRWVASRKAAVVRAVLYGLLTEEQAQEMFAISEEELAEWVRGAALMGMEGLKATAVAKLREGVVERSDD